MQEIQKLNIHETLYAQIHQGVLAYKTKYLASHGKESGWQKELAQKAAVSHVYISLIAKDKRADKTLQAIGRDAWAQIALALNLASEQSAWTAVPTSVYKSVYKICYTAKRHSYAVGIDGEAGIGKTYTLKRFQALEDQVVFVQGSVDLSAKGFLLELATALGIQAEGKSQRELTDSFCRQLRNKSIASREKPLVIIDEASKLRDSVLHKFITLYNELEGFCGFVLCGCRLESKLITGRARGKIGYDEIYSRLGAEIKKQEPCTQQDLTDLCLANGIMQTAKIANIWHQSRGHIRQAERLIKHYKHEQTATQQAEPQLSFA